MHRCIFNIIVQDLLTDLKYSFEYQLLLMTLNCNLCGYRIKNLKILVT